MTRLVTVRRLQYTEEVLAEIVLPGGTMRLTRSLASGLTRAPGDPAGVFWGIGDRGPNIGPMAAAERYGVGWLRGLSGIDGAKVMPLPLTGPALARFRIAGDVVLLEEVADLADSSGAAIGGLPVPGAAHAEAEPVFNLGGQPLALAPGGADSEGIAALADGSFWIAEEYGPSLLRVSRSGEVLCRWVPRGLQPCFAGALYPVVEALPWLASTRKLNRGFEGVAASADGRDLYAAFQSPLAHPDRAAHLASSHVRIWHLAGSNGALLGEYVYPLDPPESFRRDNAEGPVARDDIKLAELQLDGSGGLLVMERVTASTKIYRVGLPEALRAPPTLADPATRPTLEQQSRAELQAAEVPLLEKQLLFSSDDHPQVCPDLEGMVLIGPGHLLLSNDSDYGIEGAETQFWLVNLQE